MKKLFIISESEKERILGMHRNAIKNNYLKEAVTAEEPVTATGGAGFKVYFKESGSTLNEEATTMVVNYLKKVLKKSMPTIEKFFDSKEHKLPKFLEIGSSTSSTGSREKNAEVGQARINTMIDCVYDAFDELGKENGSVVGADYVQSFIKTNTDYTYNPSGLKKLYDAAKSAPKPEERYAYIIIKDLSTMGNDWKKISSIADSIEKAIDSIFGKYVDIDEDGVAKAICKCETFSDIEDLNTELKKLGGLQKVINRAITDGLTQAGSDTEERIKIKDCLNKASNNSSKGNVADIAGDKLTIIGI